MTEQRTWSRDDGFAAAAGRDRDRSAWSDVPKTSGPNGQYSTHHRQLLSRGGTHSPANLVTLTGSGTTGEHGWAHAHPDLATILGYIVPSWVDPATVPIYRINHYGTAYDWHLQTDDEQLEPCPPPAYFSPEQIATALDVFAMVQLNSRRTADFHTL